MQKPKECIPIFVLTQTNSSKWALSNELHQTGTNGRKNCIKNSLIRCDQMHLCIEPAYQHTKCITNDIIELTFQIKLEPHYGDGMECSEKKNSINILSS